MRLITREYGIQNAEWIMCAQFSAYTHYMSEEAGHYNHMHYCGCVITLTPVESAKRVHYTHTT